tara:strand:- start:203 stop:553 length:351 start_codon:yes stop_codon:yes gene_type:complete
MSDSSTTYLRLNKKETKALLGWFIFQELANVAPYEGGETSTIDQEEIALLNEIQKCIKKMDNDNSRPAVMRLAPRYCKIVFNWYSNLPDCFIDDIDANIHASLGMFLIEYDDSDDI